MPNSGSAISHLKFHSEASSLLIKRAWSQSPTQDLDDGLNCY